MQPVLHALRLCGWPARTVPCAGGAAGHRDGARALQHGRLRAAVPGVAEGHGAAQARLPAVLDAGAALAQPCASIQARAATASARGRGASRAALARAAPPRAAGHRQERSRSAVLQESTGAGEGALRNFNPSALLRGSCVSRGVSAPYPSSIPARAGRRAGAGERAGPGHAGAPAALPGAPARLPA